MDTPTIAVIGANNDRAKFANKAVRAWQARGYRVYPIHPDETEVEGLRAYPTVTDVPETLDEATLYVRPSIGIGILNALKAKGVSKLYVNPGAGSPELMEKAASLGLEAIEACSIFAAGSHPSDL